MHVIVFLMLVQMSKHVGVSIKRVPFIHIQHSSMGIIGNTITEVHGVW